MRRSCKHLDEIRAVKAKTDGCEECLAIGDDWVHLRLCLSCGHVGCCDSSRNRHASRHFNQTGHPVVRSLEPGEGWGWCYADQLLIRSRELAAYLEQRGVAGEAGRV
jgi:uncharacterized UBP type Zn finger protein